MNECVKNSRKRNTYCVNLTVTLSHACVNIQLFFMLCVFGVLLVFVVVLKYLVYCLVYFFPYYTLEDTFPCKLVLGQ